MKLTLTQSLSTIDLNTYPCKVLDGYKPETPLGDEASLVETIDCIYKGTDAQIKAFCKSINKLLQYALEMADDKQDLYTVVYINYALDNDDTAWRSRVSGGKVILHPQITNDFRQGKWRFTITLERDPWWEGDETQIALTNTNGTAVTTALPVYNCNDGSGTPPADRVNRFKCGAIDGDLAAPIILEVDANFGLATAAGGEMWVGMWNSTRNGTIGADDMVLTYELGTDQADAANSSGGSYHRESFSDLTAAEIAEIAMTFESGFGGKWFKPLIRIKTKPTTGERFWVWWKTRKWVDTVYTDWETSGKVLVNPDSGFSYILELPPMRIPPTSVMDNDLDLAVQFWVQAEAAGSHTFDVDYVVFMPMNGYRKYVQIGSMPISQYMQDDGIWGVVYDPADGSSPFVAYGEPMMLKPWEPEHLFLFAIATSTSSAIASKVGDMKLWYRPRKSAL